jgi:hypothetical protein
MVFVVVLVEMEEAVKGVVECGGRVVQGGLSSFSLMVKHSQRLSKLD